MTGPSLISTADILSSLPILPLRNSVSFPGGVVGDAIAVLQALAAALP